MTKVNIKKIQKKFIPVIEKEYLITDSCMWEMEISNDYNPYDDKRRPHAIQLVDVKTGTVVHLKSGSIVKIIKAVC